MSPKNEFEDVYDGHHKPRNLDKKKRNRNFAEDAQDRRASRISFKNYLRELQEEDLEDELDDESDSI